MRFALLGGLRIENGGRELHVTGSMQIAVLFRLAIDAGSAVSYRSIAEDVWPQDAPENTRAALQSIVSRVRSQLPDGSIESTPGGYRLAVGRADVDALLFADLIAEASVASTNDAARIASDALDLWRGEPWIPSEDFDWFAADLQRDRQRALQLGGVAGRTATRAGVPAPLTTLIGRAAELETIRDQLDRARLVTIIGTGGAGKTRLAIEAARSQGSSLFVELAPAGPAEVAAAVLAATGRDIRAGSAATEPIPTRDRIVDALAGRDVLLVLDNCEHVIESVASLADHLLPRLPRLRILATSREPLGVPGEAFVNVGPLDDEDALRLFAERAASAQGRELSDPELRTAATICSRLDGLALAIELAAARLRTIGVDEVLVGLDDRFALLTGGLRTVLPRHRTLRAMVDWSWSLLEPAEQHVLAWFSVFPSGVDARDASALARALGSPTAGVFDSLVDRSLLYRAQGRYRALETIREYGVERLSEAGTLAEARTAQVHYVAKRAAEVDRDLRGPGLYEALAWFDGDEDNIAAALRFTVQADMPDEAVDLSMSVFWYWTIRDRQAESAEWIAAIAPLAQRVDSDAGRLIAFLAPMVVAMTGASSDKVEQEAIEQLIPLMPKFDLLPDSHDVLQVLLPALRAFTAEANKPGWMTRITLPRDEDLTLAPWPSAVFTVIRAAFAQNRGDLSELGKSSAIAVSRFEALGDWWGLALSQQMRSEWFAATGNLDEALRLSDLSTENMRRITSSWDLAQQQGLAISILVRQGRADEARERLAQLQAESQASGKIGAIAQVLITAVAAHVSLGDVDSARAAMEQYDEIFPSLPNPPGQLVAWAETGRAGICLLSGDPDAAETALRTAAGQAIATHDHPVIGSVALGLGSLALARGDIPLALKAVDLHAAIVGGYDATNLQVIAIERAATDAGVRRIGDLPTRLTAIESLQQLVGGT